MSSLFVRYNFRSERTEICLSNNFFMRRNPNNPNEIGGYNTLSLGTILWSRACHGVHTRDLRY